MGTSMTKPLHIYRRSDPDETEGRKLYRALAKAEARRQIACEFHRFRLKKVATTKGATK